MVFHRSRIKTISINLVILKETLEITRSTKFVRVIIDNKLKWTDHLNPIIILHKKCIQAITFSHYLAPSKPLFDSLGILKFESYSTGSVPPPI